MIETPWEKLTSRLKITGRGPVFEARCPAHDDKHASLSVTQNPQGDVLITCHAGCEIENIAARLGLEMTDLFMPEDVQKDSPPVVYTYHDERGMPLIEVHKTWDKKFKQKRAGAEEWGLGDARRVPYRLPELLRAKPNEPVFIVEGEKDVENAMAKLGVVATCNLGGAGKGKWRAEWGEYFAERHVVVVPDNDEVGRSHAEEIRKALDQLAASLVVLHLPNVPEKGDLSDWIRAGGTREQLTKLVDAARLGKHPHVLLGHELHEKVFSLYDHGFVKGMSTLFKTIDPHYTVRMGEWTVISGNPGAGKSSFADHLAVNLAIQNMKFGIFSAENLPIERHVASIAERYVGKPFEAPISGFGRPRMEPRELEVALSFIEERFHFIEPQESGQGIDAILDASKWLVDKMAVKGIVIDPWNELDHTRPKGQTETDHIGESLQKIRRFARHFVIHIFVVAHPQKMQRGKDGKFPVPTLWDIHGSAHWRNKADNGLIVYRDQDGDVPTSEIHIQKIRFKEVGRIGVVTLGYDKPTGRYSDIETDNRLFSTMGDDE